MGWSRCPAAQRGFSWEKAQGICGAQRRGTQDSPWQTGTGFSVEVVRSQPQRQNRNWGKGGSGEGILEETVVCADAQRLDLILGCHRIASHPAGLVLSSPTTAFL